MVKVRAEVNTHTHRGGACETGVDVEAILGFAVAASQPSALSQLELDVVSDRAQPVRKMLWRGGWGGRGNGALGRTQHEPHVLL